MPPTITTCQRRQQKMRVLAQRNRLKSSADDAGYSCQARTECEDEDEKNLNPVAEDRQHVAIINPGADHHADSRAVKRQPHADADHNRGDENHEPHARILKKYRLAA